ncbi:transporter [Acanthopleuribacter pedis]|uniref:Transporter n=1 Tax=Acanthopleuribacter pedis TaxID=442870 RepID=A0A8J7QKH5_9BACT|nr:transporter [Acanthopleuribacter pedis]MBO1319883.1 transporter [Acanthopleuribacter pedis]
MTLLLLYLIAFQAPAEPAFSSDRPDQSDAPATVGAGYFQLEAGFQRTHYDTDFNDIDIDQVPVALLRIGISEDFELRLGYDGFIDIDAGRFDGNDGSGDGHLGFKWRFHNGDSGQWALIGDTNLTVGDDDIVSDEIEPSLKLAYGGGLTDSISFGANFGVSTQDEDGDLETNGLYSVVLGFSVSERVGAFVEVFGEIPASAEGRPRNSADAGLTFTITETFQWDVAVSAGISETAPDWAATTGFAYRF